jgi:hypothetical protein
MRIFISAGKGTTNSGFLFRNMDHILRSPQLTSGFISVTVLSLNQLLEKE